MREIFFRGKRLTDGKWVYGCLIFNYTKGAYHILTNFSYSEKSIENMELYEVKCSSVGQYVCTDKNGTKIFEGDIVKNDWCFLRGYSVVKFGQYKTLDMGSEYQQGHLGFYLEHIHEVDKKTTRKDIMYFANKCEVIGNIHDNPELLGGGEE